MRRLQVVRLGWTCCRWADGAVSGSGCRAIDAGTRPRAEWLGIGLSVGYPIQI